MIINSVYTAQDMPPALSQFEVREDKAIVLLKLWRQGDDENLIEVLQADKDAINLFNGIRIDEKLSSAFAESVRRFGVSHIKVVEALVYYEGLEIFRRIEKCAGFEVSAECKRWANLAERFNRESRIITSEQMAFLQGIVRAHKEANRPEPFFRATTESKKTAAERMGYSEPRRFGTPPL